VDATDKNGNLISLGGVSLLELTLRAALQSEQLSEVVVSTDDEQLATMARGLGASVPFLREPRLNAANVTIPMVLNYTLDKLEKDGNKVDVVAFMEVSHPFRSPQLIDQVVKTMHENNLDSVFTVMEARSNYWRMDKDGIIQRVYDGDVYRSRNRKAPLYKEMLGLVCATRREFVTDEHLLGTAIGVAPVHEPELCVDLREPAGVMLAEAIIAKNA
jgi:CMP-N-acetylneuraminic acid synthetase